jgi:hypothetical protein
MEEIRETINSLCDKAVRYAKGFSKNLDFSEESIKDVEEILDYYCKDVKGSPLKNLIRKIKKEEPTNNQVWSMATIWGAYIGEVICRKNPGKCIWVYEDEFGNGPFLHIKVDNNNRAHPIDKAFKRLKNGPEDNVVSFYDIFTKMVLTDKFKEFKDG